MADRIIVLSLSDRVAPYQEALASFELEVEYLDNVMEVFRSCVRRPPGALIVDMVSASALESSALVNLTNLNLGWPIVRCRARPDGILMLVSLLQSTEERSARRFPNYWNATRTG